MSFSMFIYVGVLNCAGITRFQCVLKNTCNSITHFIITRYCVFNNALFRVKNTLCLITHLNGVDYGTGQKHTLECVI